MQLNILRGFGIEMCVEQFFWFLFWFDQLLYNKLCIIRVVIYQHAYTATVVSSYTENTRFDSCGQTSWPRLSGGEDSTVLTLLRQAGCKLGLLAGLDRIPVDATTQSTQMYHVRHVRYIFHKLNLKWLPLLFLQMTNLVSFKDDRSTRVKLFFNFVWNK